MRLNKSLVIIVFLMSSMSVAAQSTNKSNPTPLTSLQYTGKGPSKETNYYFNFTGGPGEVSVGLEIKAGDYSTFARLEIWSGNKTIATHNMNAATTTGESSVLKEFNLDAQGTVLIKLTLDGNLANYTITLSGAVEAASTETPPADSGSGGSTMTDATLSEASPGPTASTGGNKPFNIDLGKFKLGQFINFPKTGTLVIQLKDGTMQEIDLAGVKSVTIKK